MTTKPLNSTISCNFWSFPSYTFYSASDIFLDYYRLKDFKRQHTVTLFLNLEGDRLPGHLQEVDGLAQRLPFQADAIDGQDSVPYVDGPSPAEAGGGEGRGQRYGITPDELPV